MILLSLSSDVAYTCRSGITSYKKSMHHYNPFLVYCRELAPGTASLTGDRAKGDDSKHDSHYSGLQIY